MSADPCAPLVERPRPPQPEPKYVAQVERRLDEVLAAARAEAGPAIEIDALKAVVVSDHHKGARDGADDFQRAERAYCAALGWYLEHGYRLFVLGDAEELWEETPERVTRCYREVLELEARFLEPGRGGMVRFFGNHDDDWEDERKVERHLGPFFGAISVRESLLLPLSEGGLPRGELFFAHGHQGTSESDRWGRWARLPVRYVWRPLQRKLGWSATTPASDYGLRGKHDAALYAWARAQRQTPPLVLITGHTHRPVFSLPPSQEREPGEIAAELEGATGAGAAELRAELEHVLARRRDRAAVSLTVEPPCYFNSGCCSFPDGDITALELEGGEIRLVRWPDDDERPLPRLLGRKRLNDVFDAVAAAAPGEGEVLEQVV